MSKPIAFILLLSAVTIYGQSNDAADKSPLSVKLTLSKSEYEVGEEASCALEIKNVGKDDVLLPSFRFINAKAVGPEVGFYVERQIVKLDLRQGTKSLPMVPGLSGGSAATNREYPIVWLWAGQTITARFELNPNYTFYSVTNPGVYSVSLTLDTRKCQDEGIIKGLFAAEPVTFTIVPVPVFRAKQSDESPEAYRIASVAFYLGRFAHKQGNWGRCEEEIRNTDGFVPALIGLLGSADKEIATSASSLLRQVFPRPANSTNWVAVNSNVPKSPAEWTAWWNETGSNLPPGQLSQNRWFQMQ